MMATTLRYLLAKNRKNSPVYTTSNGKLSNHLSMVLIALNKLGATDEHLINYDKNYSPRLESGPEFTRQIIIDSKNWGQYLGNNEYYSNYIRFFQESIKSIGIENTLKKYIGKLLQGISEFHGLIRVAYAIESNDAQEIATSLAYFSGFYHSYGEIKNTLYRFQHPAEGLASIRQNKSLVRQKFAGQNIHERLDKVVCLPDFFSSVQNLEINENVFQECAELMLSLYAMTTDFVVLHALTTTHALRIVWPYIENHHECLAHYWQIICAVYIYVGAPEIPKTADLQMQLVQNIPSWSNVLLKAISATDAHAIKLVYSCYEEDKVYRNPLYLYVAARALE